MYHCRWCSFKTNDLDELVDHEDLEHDAADDSDLNELDWFEEEEQDLDD